MKTRSILKLVSLAVATVLSTAAFVPAAQAHACNGRGTITIKEGKKLGNGKTEYWYFQSGRVCGRYIA